MAKKFYPVIFLRNGDACVGSPCPDEATCRAEIRKSFMNTKKGKIVGSTFMVREDEDVRSILGSPKSRDIVKSPKEFGL